VTPLKGNPHLLLQLQLFVHRQGKLSVLLYLLAGLILVGSALEVSRTYWLQIKLQEEVGTVEKKLQHLKLSATNSPKEQSPSDILNSMQKDKLVESDLNRIFEIAFKNDIDLPQGDYQWTMDSNTSYSKFQITYPVVAPYSNVEKFVTQVLLEMPWISLNTFDIKRNGIGDADVNADLVFTMYFGNNAKIGVVTP
jgi:hypothetical protein